jgi:hypothetical protein
VGALAGGGEAREWALQQQLVDEAKRGGAVRSDLAGEDVAVTL